MRVGVILNGCGAKDGSEIHEAVITMLTLEEAGATVICYAPDKPQARVVDHLTGQEIPGSRNMMTEAARIARGSIKPLSQAKAGDLDGVVVPGGFGAAFNLCSFATQGPAMTVDADLSKLLISMQVQKKPIGAVCIAPIILAKVFGAQKVRLTLGSTDHDAARAAREFGAEMVECPSTDCVVDMNLKMVTAPAYMHEVTIKDVAAGIRKLAQKIVQLS